MLILGMICMAPEIGMDVFGYNQCSYSDLLIGTEVTVAITDPSQKS
jgi:hypothetical protein